MVVIARDRRTQWAAQFAVASELCKRGYEVSFTMGNATSVVDLMLVSPELRRMFLIDVKGLYRKNSWVVKRKVVQSDLYYILSFVLDTGTNRFFVMAQQTMNAYIEQELKRLGRPDDYSITGILWSMAEKHENRWDILPR
jgi:hypothetical protein